MLQLTTYLQRKCMVKRAAWAITNNIWMLVLGIQDSTQIQTLGVEKEKL